MSDYALRSDEGVGITRQGHSVVKEQMLWST
jgi:hypothetical protein